MSDDVISREAAIDEIKEIYEWHDNVTEALIIEHFKRMPSAQPTIDAVEVVRCRDCKWFDRTEPKQCRQHGICNIHDDFFCADGERRDPCSSQDS